MCVTWISEQTTIISLHSINCFYNLGGMFTARYVLAHYVLYSNNAMFSGRAKAEALSRRSLMTVWDRSRPHDIGGEHSITGTSFSPSIWYYPVSVIPPTLHTQLHLHIALTTRTNAQSLGTCHKAITFSEIRGAPHRRVLSLFHAQRGQNVECLNVTN